MQKIDFKKQESSLYAPSQSWQLVEVPPMKFATISGVGNPNLSEDYAAAVSTLYALSYAAKFASKKQLGLDDVVLPLEGLWSADDAQVFKVSDKDNYQWTMMIRQPNWLDLNTLEEASLTAARKNLTYHGKSLASSIFTRD